jgi:hypothetical protein
MNAEAVAAPEHGIMSLFSSAFQQKAEKVCRSPLDIGRETCQ